MIAFHLEKKRCLLIDPGINFLGSLKGFYSTRHFPFGVLSIASFLENNGCPVKALPMDCHLPETKESIDRKVLLKRIEDMFRREISNNSLVVIGVSATYTVQCKFALQIVGLIKKIDPNIITVVGGPHVTFLEERTFSECPSLDVVVRGEGEWTMLDLVSSIVKKADLGTVAGITLKKNGQIFRTADRPLGNLSELPIMNFGLIPAKFYRNRVVNIAASRGCIYTCKFCAERIFWGNRVRMTPIDKLIAETKGLFKKYNIAFLSFEDSMLYIGSDYFKQLSSRLKDIKGRRLGHMMTRIEPGINRESLIAVKKAGFSLLLYGLESGSEKVLKAMDKRIKIEQVRRILKLTKESGINVGASWLIGHPGDNPEEADKSLRFMESLYAERILDRSMVHRFIPYPGTEFFNNPRKYGIEILDYNWEEWRRYDRNKGVCQLDDFKDNQITEAHNRAIGKSSEREFYNSNKNSLLITAFAIPKKLNLEE